MKRQGPKGQPWQPKSSSRICSIHFVSCKPTAENPDPTLNIGYVQTTAPRKRKLPKERSSIPTKRSKNIEDTLNFNDRTNPSTSSTVNAGVLDDNASLDNDISSLNCNDANECVDFESANTKLSNIIHDHNYCYGWKKINNPDFCFEKNCLDEKKSKDD